MTNEQLAVLLNRYRAKLVDEIGIAKEKIEVTKRAYAEGIDPSDRKVFKEMVLPVYPLLEPFEGIVLDLEYDIERLMQ